LVFWAKELDKAGGNLNKIIDVFANSEESKDLYGIINNDTIGTVVNSMYNALFGRDAEPEAPGKPNYYVRILPKAKSPPAT